MQTLLEYMHRPYYSTSSHVCRLMIKYVNKQNPFTYFTTYSLYFPLPYKHIFNVMEAKRMSSLNVFSSFSAKKEELKMLSDTSGQ